MDEVCDKCQYCADHSGISLFSWSALHGHARCLELQIQAGADVNKASGGGFTPLLHAAESQDNVMKWGDIYMENAMDTTNVTFKSIGEKDTYKCLGLLLDAGVDVNAVSGDSKTTLMWLAEYGNHEYVQKLIDAGADVNAKDHSGTTALLMAATVGHDKCVDVLLRAGADVKPINTLGYTALDMATVAGHEACVRLLKEGPSPIESTGAARAVTTISRGSTRPSTSTPSIPDLSTIDRTTNERNADTIPTNTGKTQSCTCCIL